jgi:hypothetical protein
MRIYAYAMTEAINTAHLLDTYYFMNKYHRAEERWRTALDRISAMNRAVAEAAHGRA